MIKVLTDMNDDLELVYIVEKIFNGFIRNYEPNKIYIIKIDNWFDAKWRLFAGKILGIAGVHRRELVVPPFNPNRVLQQLYFEKSGEKYVNKNAPYLHYDLSSEENLSRKLSAEYSGSEMFIWYCGNSKNSLRGSLMIYYIAKETQNSWYISFLKKTEWQIYKTDQISRNEVLSLMK